MIEQYVTIESKRRAALDLDGGCTTAEILNMGAALIELAETTRDHSQDLIADGFTLRAEEAELRASKYEETYEELKRIWGRP